MDADIISAAPDFRKTILALLTETDWLARFGTILAPEFFPTKEEQAYVRFVNEFFQHYRKTPSYAAIQQGIGVDGELIGQVSSVQTSDLEYAADVALDFARVQAMKIAILESVDDIKKGDLHKPQERVKAAQQIGADRFDLGMDLIDDVNLWVGEELHGRRYPTGWVPVDNLLGGGIAAGELGMVMAPPGMGKTTMLVNIGHGLAGLYGATNVLHVSNEIQVKDVMSRYAARVAGVRLNRDDGMDEAHFKKQLVRIAGQRLRGHLHVVFGKWTISDIQSTIENLASTQNFQTGALVVDYSDLMMPTHRREEKRFELADICRDLRQLGNDYYIPVWTASQSGRGSYYKETVESYDVAEAIEKVAVVDVLITLSQTRDEEKLGQGRLVMAKVRNSKSHSQFPCKIDFEHQSIIARAGNAKTE